MKKVVFLFLAILVLCISCEMEPEHVHSFDTEWTYDTDYHWHAATCEHTDQVKDKAPHVWDSGTILAEASYGVEGSVKFTCEQCGQTKIETIPELVKVSYYSDGQLLSEKLIHKGCVADSTVAPSVEDGWEFVCWNVNGTDTQFDFNQSVISDIKLDAYVRRIEHKITIVSSIDGSSKEYNIAEGDTYTLTQPSDYSNYCFQYWSQDGKILDSCGILMGKNDIIIIEKWLSSSDFTIDSNHRIGLSTFIDKSALKYIRLPEKFFGEDVTGIADYAFNNCSSLETVIIPDSYSSIGDCAFLNCTALSSISLPASLTQIGEWSFEYCPIITIVVPEGTTDIGYGAFMDCSLLESISLPSSIATIGSFVFQNCPNLKTVILNEGITDLGYCMFNGCNSLETITLPESLKSIPQYAFENCANLKTIRIPEAVDYVGNYAFLNCNSMVSIKVDRTVLKTALWANDWHSYCSAEIQYEPPVYKTITWNAQGGTCESLESEIEYDTTVVFPKDPEREGYRFLGWYDSGEGGDIIGNSSVVLVDATYYAHWIKTVTVSFEMNGAPSILSQVIDINTCAQEPESPQTKGSEFAGWYSDAEFSSAFDFTTAINDSCTVYAKWIQKYGSDGLEFSSTDGINCTITGIGNCSDTDVIIPEYILDYCVTAIGDEAFADCSSITSIELSATVQTIGYRAFMNCTGLTSFTFPETLVSTGLQVFYECTNLKTVFFDSPNVSYPQGETVLNTPYITTVYFGDHVSTIPSYICYGCSNLEKVVLSENARQVGSYSFYSCTGIDTIDFPDGFLSFGFYGFHSAGLTKLVIPTTVTSINESFRGCYNLEYIILPASVTAILDQAFYVCSSFVTYYLGSPTDYEYITIDSASSVVSNNVYYYSENAPSEEGKWWHYDSEGEPAIWD